MYKNKYNFIIEKSKTNYSFFLHQCVLSVNLISSLLLNNNFFFSRFIVHNTSSIVLICFSFVKPKKSQICIRSFFYFLEKHLSLCVFNNAPVKLVSNITVASFVSFDAHSLVFLLKAIIETEKRLDPFFFDLVALLRLKFKKQQSDLLGVFINISGRLNGSDRSKKKIVSFGKGGCSFNYKKLDFYFCNAFTKHGAIGIKVWIFYK